MIVLLIIISMLYLLLQVLGVRRIFADNIVGEEKKDFVYGDVNDDGIVDIKDIALIKRKLSGWNVILGPVREEEGQNIAGDDDVPIETVVEKETTEPIEETVIEAETETVTEETATEETAAEETTIKEADREEAITEETTTKQADTQGGDSIELPFVPANELAK